MHSAVIDPSTPWRLSHILAGHVSDVKCISTSTDGASVELLFSASRDETGRSWYRNVDDNARLIHKAASYQASRFQNAVVHVNDHTSKETGSVLLGGLDAGIRAFEASSSYSEKPQRKTLQILNDHFDNVCHLSTSPSNSQQTLLISASWDCTSRVWSRDDESGSWHHLHTLKGHEKAVWAAEVVSGSANEEKYLTASADLFVRFWQGEVLKRVYAGHIDVVRAIALLPTRSEAENHYHSTSLPLFYDEEHLFVTASNDGTVRVWSLDDRRCPSNNPSSGGEALRVLTVADSVDLLYDVKYAGSLAGGTSRIVASCGEDGLVRGWNIENGTIAFSIPQPVTSVWSLAVLPLSGDLVTANSDGKVRIFTQNPKAEDLVDNRKDTIYEISPAELQDYKDQCEVVKAARRQQTVQAEVVAQPCSIPEDLNLEGERYDAILKIDVTDGADPLPLPLNRGDDPRSAARHFLQRHSLPTSYEDQIVNFIEQIGPK